jgi:hypothetical protein
MTQHINIVNVSVRKRKQFIITSRRRATRIIDTRDTCERRAARQATRANDTRDARTRRVTTCVTHTRDKRETTCTTMLVTHESTRLCARTAR